MGWVKFLKGVRLTPHPPEKGTYPPLPHRRCGERKIVTSTLTSGLKAQTVTII
jgi:hypothetical protein